MNEIDKLMQELYPDGVEYRKLGEVCEINTGEQFNKRDMDKKGTYPVLNGGIAPSGYSERYNTEENTITISQGGASAGYVNFMDCKFWAGAHCYVVKPISETISNRFLYFFLKNEERKIMEAKLGAGIPGLNRKNITSISIPVPPLPIQEKIVEVLDKFTKLEARRKQYEYYREKLLTFSKDDENVKWYTLGEIGEVCMCRRIMKHQTSKKGDIPFYKIGSFGETADAFIPRALYEEYKEKYSFPKKGDVLISAAGTIGKAVIYDGKDAYYQDSNIVWIDNDETKVLNKYLFYLYSIIKWKTDGGTIKRLYNNHLKSTRIPLPLLSEQRRIADILDKFEALTTSLQDGLPAEIAARRKQYEYYREQLLSFKRKGEA